MLGGDCTLPGSCVAPDGRWSFPCSAWALGEGDGVSGADFAESAAHPTRPKKNEPVTNNDIDR